MVKEKEKNIEKKPEEEEEFNSNVVYSFHSNATGMTRSDEEFLIEFYQFPVKDDKTVDSVRAYLPPMTTKRLLISLTSTIEDYEKENGKIEVEEKE